VLPGDEDRLDADLVSAPVPIKDGRGVTSSGIGDPLDPWSPFRRFTVRELASMPETFDAAAAGYPGYPLLHNTGCFAVDLRRPVFRRTRPDGSLDLMFDFPRRVVRIADRWVLQAESEDWFFSRKLHEAGGRSFITRKVRLAHVGQTGYSNHEPWGAYENGDEDSAAKWRRPR
jgi:hypothetical protein